MRKNKVTKEEAALAAINILSNYTVTLGDKEFKVVNLSYDDYIKFITLLTPMLETFFGSIASVSGVRLAPSSGVLSPGALIKYAGDVLPELACIVCNQTDPSVTVNDVKLWAQQGEPKGPFKLAEVVIKQIEQNKIINDFASFFAQMLPMIKTALNPNL